MVYHNASGEGYIAFSSPPSGGPEEHARFHMRDFFVDGHPIQQKTYHSWDLEKKMEVTFSAIRLDSPFVSREMTANYLCVAAWIGAKPTEDKLRMSMQKTTYFAGAMSHLVDARTGIMEANNKFVLFDATCFMGNGTSLDLTNENALTAALQLGEPIYCYAKKVAPQEMEGKWVTYKAEHVWKGRKAIGLASALTKQKSESAEDMSVCAVDEEDGEDGKKGPRRCALPQPSAATDSNVTGRIVELPSVQHGIIELSSSGEKCLFPRSRVFIQGEKLKGRDILHNHVKVRLRRSCRGRERERDAISSPGEDDYGGARRRHRIAARAQQESFSSPSPPLPPLPSLSLSFSLSFSVSTLLPPTGRIKIQMIISPRRLSQNREWRSQLHF